MKERIKIGKFEINLGKALPFAALILFLGVFLFSLGKFAFTSGGSRRNLYFKSFEDGKTYVEVHFLPSDPVQGKVSALVDELLLGPYTNRFAPLFAKGTKAEFCIQEGKVLYVGLSEDALNLSSECCTIEEGVSLLKTNVLKNTRKIDTIEVFIGGESIK